MAKAPIQVSIRESKWTRETPFIGPLTREQAEYRSRQLFDHEVSHWTCARTIWTDSPEFLELPKFTQQQLISSAKSEARIAYGREWPLGESHRKRDNLSLEELFGTNSDGTFWQAVKGDFLAMFKRWLRRA